jgi:hypothetical protein
MRTPVDDQDPLAELSGHALGNRQTEKSGADDEEVEASGHRLPRVSDCETAARLAAALRPGLIATTVTASADTGVAGNDRAVFGDESRDLLTIGSRHSSHIIHVRTIGHVR